MGMMWTSAFEEVTADGLASTNLRRTLSGATMAQRPLQQVVLTCWRSLANLFFGPHQVWPRELCPLFLNLVGNNGTLLAKEADLVRTILKRSSRGSDAKIYLTAGHGRGSPSCHQRDGSSLNTAVPCLGRAQKPQTNRAQMLSDPGLSRGHGYFAGRNRAAEEPSVPHAGRELTVSGQARNVVMPLMMSSRSMTGALRRLGGLLGRPLAMSPA